MSLSCFDHSTELHFKILYVFKKYFTNILVWWIISFVLMSNEPNAPHNWKKSELRQCSTFKHIERVRQIEHILKKLRNFVLFLLLHFILRSIKMKMTYFGFVIVSIFFFRKTSFCQVELMLSSQWRERIIEFTTWLRFYSMYAFFL